jgi:excisionase family DNA binding protein
MNLANKSAPGGNQGRHGRVEAPEDCTVAAYTQTAARQAAPMLLKVPEAAALLGVGRSKCYELLASGALPSVSVGRARRVPSEALRWWVRSGCPEAPGAGREWWREVGE